MMSPMTSAMVLNTSKYKRARAPVLPTAFMFSMPEMPSTTVQKMMGAIIILMSLIKPSPKGFMASPAPGFRWPRITPIKMAIST